MVKTLAGFNVSITDTKQVKLQLAERQISLQMYLPKNTHK